MNREYPDFVKKALEDKGFFTTPTTEKAKKHQSFLKSFGRLDLSNSKETEGFIRRLRGKSK